MDSLEHIAKAIRLIEEPFDDLSGSLRQMEEDMGILRAAINKLKSEIAFGLDAKEVDEIIAVTHGRAS